jgi:hypothetical protein
MGVGATLHGAKCLMLGWMQREAAAERALKEAEEKRKRDEEAAEQARLVAERTAALQVQTYRHRVRYEV